MITLPQLVAKSSQIIPAEIEKIVPEKIIPAIDQKTYDKYWVTQLSFLLPSPTEEARMVAVLVPARDVEVLVDAKATTVKELMPDAEKVVVVVNDVFKKSDSDPIIADTLTKALTAVMNAGIEKNILK